MMRDRFRTSEDGKAASFDLPKQGGQRLGRLMPFLPIMLVLLFAGFVLWYFYDWTHSLSKRIDSLQSRIESSQSTNAETQRLRREIERLSHDLVAVRDGIKKLRQKEESSTSVQQVQEVQRLLRGAGFNIRSVDGILGSNTIDAVRAFQRAEGLDVNGDVGDPQFLERLRAKAARESDELNDPDQ